MTTTLSRRQGSCRLEHQRRPHVHSLKMSRKERVISTRTSECEANLWLWNAGRHSQSKSYNVRNLARDDNRRVCSKIVIWTVGQLVLVFRTARLIEEGLFLRKYHHSPMSVHAHANGKEREQQHDRQPPGLDADPPRQRRTLDGWSGLRP